MSAKLTYEQRLERLRTFIAEEAAAQKARSLVLSSIEKATEAADRVRIGEVWRTACQSQKDEDIVAAIKAADDAWWCTPFPALSPVGALRSAMTSARMVLTFGEPEYAEHCAAMVDVALQRMTGGDS